MSEAALAQAREMPENNTESETSLEPSKSVTLAGKLASTPHSTARDFDDLAAALNEDARERYATLLRRVKLVKKQLSTR